MEAAILDARRRTLGEVQAWSASAAGGGGLPEAADPAKGASAMDSFPGFGNLSVSAGGGSVTPKAASETAPPSPMCITPNSAGGMTPEGIPAGAAIDPSAAAPPMTAAAGHDLSSLEARIIAKIASVCTPGGVRASSQQHLPRGGSASQGQGPDGGVAAALAAAAPMTSARHRTSSGGGGTRDCETGPTRDQAQQHGNGGGATAFKKPPVPPFNSGQHAATGGSLSSSMGGGLSSRRGSIFKV